MPTAIDPYPGSGKSLPGHPLRGGIPDHVINAVRDAADIAEIASGYTTLKRVGQEYAALCPYPDHDDKTPSFYVNPSKGVYVCRGACGRGGDAIQLVRDLEGLEFIEAIERLADRYGIEGVSREDEDDDARQRREARRRRERTTRGALEFAARFYERRLWRGDEGADARRYLVEERGLSQDTLEAFGAGFAPASGRTLIAAATSPDGPVARSKRGRAMTYKDLDEAGLLDRRGSERFAGRVVFPVRDDRGRTVGFGARVLPGAESRAKYLNSPDSEIFDKGSRLFGLDIALPHIRRERQAILVEGYTDVLALHQAGVGTAVAAMGTALGAKHLRKLAPHVDKVYFVFDPDEAGEKATERARGAAEIGLDLRVVRLEGGDPADWLREHNASEFQALLEDAQDALEHEIQRRAEKARASSAHERSRALGGVRTLVLELSDPVLRQEYARTAAAAFKVPLTEMIASDMAAPRRESKGGKRRRDATPPVADPLLLAARDFVALAVADPKEAASALVAGVALEGLSYPVSVSGEDLMRESLTRVHGALTRLVSGREPPGSEDGTRELLKDAALVHDSRLIARLAERGEQLVPSQANTRWALLRLAELVRTRDLAATPSESPEWDRLFMELRAIRDALASAGPGDEAANDAPVGVAR